MNTSNDCSFNAADSAFLNLIFFYDPLNVDGQ